MTVPAGVKASGVILVPVLYDQTAEGAERVVQCDGLHLAARPESHREGDHRREQQLVAHSQRQGSIVHEVSYPWFAAE